MPVEELVVARPPLVVEAQTALILGLRLVPRRWRWRRGLRQEGEEDSARVSVIYAANAYTLYFHH